MTMNRIIIGVDDRVDEHCQAQPWRIVLFCAALPAGRSQYLMRLPDDRRYLSPPRHPLHGDLMLIPDTANQQIQKLVQDIRALKVDEVHLDAYQYEGVVGRTLIWNGIEPRVHVVEEDPDNMVDTFSIGGSAGHQISIIERKLGDDA